MQQSPEEEWENIISRRLITSAETDEPTVKPGSVNTPPVDGEAVAPTAEIIAGDDDTDDAAAGTKAVIGFTKIEKSLASLGFFTPSSRRIKDQKVKRMSFTREVDGQRVEGTAEIIPSALFGLPITADQDKYLALQQIITERLQAEGQLTNPIRFKSSDLIRLLNKSTKTGKNYKEVGEWLDVMSSTTIFSAGVVYNAKQKRFAKDRFRVFDRAVSVGKEMEDGTVADANYVWLSTWQLENINNNYLLPIDLETYRQLKNHIAKALVPLLQIWLFASHRAGSFEKRYDDLCEILTLQKYRAPSQILRQLKPSLDELTKHEYLEKWQIEQTSDRKAYKIVLFHGAKFRRDRRRRLGQKNQIADKQPIIIGQSESLEPSLPEPGKLEVTSTPPTVVTAAGQDLVVSSDEQFADVAEIKSSRQEPEPDDRGSLIDELAARGLMPSAAMKLIASLPPSRRDQALDYIEYWDSLKANKEVGPGLLYELIRNGDRLPANFQTSRERAAKKTAADRQHALAMAQQSLYFAYEEYERDALDRYIEIEVPPDEYQRIYNGYKQQMSKQGSFFENRTGPMFEEMIQAAVRAEIRKTMNVIPFPEFCRREASRVLADSDISPAELGITNPPGMESEPEGSTKEPEAEVADSPLRN